MSVSIVITSCNRPSLLSSTLLSLFTYNTYNKIEKLIIIDDSGIKGCIDECLSHIPETINSVIIYNESNIGQILSIDIAYSYVESEYIFHCEDDWEFYRSGFIEDSMSILQHNEQILCIWLRQYINLKVYQNGHPILPQIHDNSYRILSTFRERTNIWNGFTFNPSLRRLKDYIAVKPFGKLLNNDEKYGGCIEQKLSCLYSDMGFKCAITLNELGYVKHIGWDQPVRDA
jgi:hypothetical protein